LTISEKASRIWTHIWFSHWSEINRDCWEYLDKI